MEQKPEIDVEELKRGGVVKLKGKDMFSIWVKTLCCNLSAKQLKKVADISDKYGRSLILFTTRQIPIIPFINLKDVDAVKKELSQVYLELDPCGPRVRNINVCYDEKICPDAIMNSLSLGEKLEKYFYDPILYKIKIGASGCKKDCIISRVLNDISFIGMERNGRKGYDVYLGGRLGLNPFVGIRMSMNLSEEECVKFVQNYFDFIKLEGKQGERGADLINRLGVEKLKQELNKNSQEKVFQKPIECKTKLEEKESDKIILKVRATCGEVTSKQVKKIAEISEKYGKGFIHFAVRGDPEIPCIDKEYFNNIKKELEKVNLQILGKGIDNIQTCFGDCCTNSACDTQSLLRKVEKKVKELEIDNFNIKISGAGCPNSCGIAHLNDIGFMGVVEPEVDVEKCNGCGICEKACKRKAIQIIDKIAVIDKTKCSYCGECIRSCPVDAKHEKRKGFAVLVGGREGEDTRLGEVIAEFLSEDEALRITEEILKILKEKNVNASMIISKVGIEKFKTILGV
ncbi:MAG: 4Fe-4S dicluster domain-containing protein [Candidatus Aminicenantes bacterium]|nr:MAG: 4Fe-4S dicluster domain-containing protein [Candidatus Aminicenantes bacterium]